MQKTKVLYISYDGMTDNLGQSQVIPYLKGLTQKGYEFTILSFEKAENYQKCKTLIQEILSDANISWYPLNYTSKPPVISTIKDIRFLLKTARDLHQKENFSIVHCRSYISAFAGLMLQKKYGVKFIFDMRGFWADERVEGNIWSIKNPIFNWVYKYFKKQENKYISKSNYTISLTNCGKNEIHSWKHIENNPVPIEVIPCCADFDHFKQSDKQELKTQQLKKELGIAENDFVLSYLGSVGTWYMLDEMLDFYKTLLKNKPKAKFLFITGEPESMVLNTANARNLPVNQFIVRSATRELVPAYIALSSVSMFFIKPVFSKKASSPTKMAELMGMGVPIICNNNVGDVEQIIEETGAGYAISDFTSEEYQRAINKIDDLLNLDKEKIRQAAIDHFSLDVGVNKYAEVYKRVLELS